MGYRRYRGRDEDKEGERKMWRKRKGGMHRKIERDRERARTQKKKSGERQRHVKKSLELMLSCSSSEEVH